MGNLKEGVRRLASCLFPRRGGTACVYKPPLREGKLQGESYRLREKRVPCR